MVTIISIREAVDSTSSRTTRVRLEHYQPYPSQTVASSARYSYKGFLIGQAKVPYGKNNQLQVPRDVDQAVKAWSLYAVHLARVHCLRPRIRNDW